MARSIVAALILMGLSMAGCATIVEGTDQSIAVTLSPETATCAVLRDGARLTSISKNNRFINISKSKNDLIIECKASGYYDETVTIESSASGWGVVGCIFIDLCITDYSTGALNKYPETINIALAPKAFESAESRDEWYSRRRAVLDRRWKDVLSRKSVECDATGPDSQCRTELAAMEKKRDDELRKLERRRLETATSQPATRPSSVESRLKAAKDLFDRGVISREEYEQKRREIMSSI